MTRSNERNAEVILRRAAELDEQLEGRFTASELREAAIASGIRPAAVDLALAEAVEAPQRSRSRWRRWTERALAGLTGFAMGALADVLPGASAFVSEPTLPVLAVTGLLAGAAVALANRSARDGHLHFQSLNASLWAGFGVVWLGLGATASGTMLMIAASFGLLCAVLGSAWIETDASGSRLRSRPNG